jgi:hypothetical protein
VARREEPGVVVVDVDPGVGIHGRITHDQL